MGKIGIVGLGRMGSAIAQRYVAQGCDVTSWTRSGRSVSDVPFVSDLSKMAAQSDCLILSLYDDSAVAEVLDALLQCDLSGKLIIETSTVVPDVIRDRIDLIHAKDGMAIDAPISGGPELVTSGQCGVFIGGDDSAVQRGKTILETLTSRIFHVGPLGAGLAMKVINNGMLQTYFNGLHDLMPVARAAGLSLETALRIVCGGPAGLPMVADRIPKVLGDDTSVGFSISAASKDADVFRRVVKSYGFETPMLERFQEITDQSIEDGHGEEDPAVLIRHAYERSKLS